MVESLCSYKQCVSGTIPCHPLLLSSSLCCVNQQWFPFCFWFLFTFKICSMLLIETHSVWLMESQTLNSYHRFLTKRIQQLYNLIIYKAKCTKCIICCMCVVFQHVSPSWSLYEALSVNIIFFFLFVSCFGIIFGIITHSLPLVSGSRQRFLQNPHYPLPPSSVIIYSSRSSRSSWEASFPWGAAEN